MNRSTPYFLMASVILLSTAGYVYSQSFPGIFIGGSVLGNPGTTAGMGNPTRTPVLGATGGQTGSLGFAGVTSGQVTVQPQNAAGTYNFNLPTAAGTAGQPLLSGGGGATPQSYGTVGVASGGTNCAVASGTCLDNITGFSGTGFVQRTGPGAYTIGASSSQTYVGLATLTSPTLSDTTHINATYNTYQIIYTNVTCSVDLVRLLFHVHSGGAFQTASYIANIMTAEAGTVSDLATTGNIALSSAGLSINTAIGASGVINMYNPSPAGTNRKMVSGNGTYFANNPNPAVSGMAQFGGFWNDPTNSAVDGFEIVCSSGAVNGGTAKIYGIL